MKEPLWRRAVALAAVILVFVLIVWPLTAGASALYQAEQDGVRIILYDEPCAIEAVSNLSMRATWTEKGKTFEGCYALHPAGVVLAYFSDRTVVIFPARAFARAVTL